MGGGRRPACLPPPLDDGIYGYSGYYRLGVGIVSVPGLVYWALVAGLMGFYWSRRRSSG